MKDRPHGRPHGRMNDPELINLYWSRDESALRLTAERYEHYCMTVALNITGNREDAEECVNDTWLRAWNSIPPARPDDLCAYLAKITRHLALDCIEKRHTAKRGYAEEPTPLDELSDILSDPETPDEHFNAAALSADIDRFLRTLPRRTADLFILRYFCGESLTTLGERYGLRENTVAALLSRTRKKLKKHLLGKGYLL